MINNENIDIKNLSNEDLLSLYEQVSEHLKYLKDSIIVEEEKVEEDTEDGGDNNESSE